MSNLHSDYQLITRLNFYPKFHADSTHFNLTLATVIIHIENREQKNAVKAFAKALKMKFEVTNEEPYDPEFVAKIQESRQQA